MPYEFSWAVKDEPLSNDYSHSAKSDGQVVTGVYRILLPDSRTQVVNYRADEHGYVADVKYEGEAKYDQHKPVHKSAYPESSYPAPKSTYGAPP
jgi:Insect cuticle protein